MNRGRTFTSKMAKPSISPLAKMVGATICCLGTIGFILFLWFGPSEYTSNSPGTNSILSSITHKQSLSSRIHEWIPNYPGGDAKIDEVDGTEGFPDWDKEFWTPIDIEVSKDPIVILCRLNYQKYYEQPHSYPMFRDVQALSNCVAGNRKRERLSVLLNDIKRANGTEAGRVIKPSGFVFHESRVGSTLVANILASDPYSLVFSESTPIANAILHCGSCSHEQHVQLFRDVLTLMGRTPIHKRLFVKFQSITVTNIDIALEAFPDTPWAFLFRQPVQTMMSHLDPQKGNSNAAPCMRSKRSPPEDVRKTVNEIASWGKVANEAWCAAHLNMLCNHAIDAYTKYGKNSSGKPRGLLVNYESLPGIIPRVVLPYLFSTEINARWLSKMETEAKHYSKSRGTRFRLFFGDSKDKDERATKEIQLYADKVLIPTYQKLNALSLEGFRAVASNLVDSNLISGNSYTWTALKEFPEKSVVESNKEAEMGQKIQTFDRDEIPHSTALKQADFVPWAPFANHHTSKTFYKPNCPFNPEPGYPKTFVMMDILKNWNADNTEIPPFHYDSLCHFNYMNATEVQIALNYRDKEVPYVMYNIPEVDGVVKKWNNLDYLSEKLGSKSYRTETSESNHFMYWRHASSAFLRTREGKGWKPPTSVISTKFDKWLEFAVKNQNKSLDSREHQYFRVSSDMGNEWLYKELPFFQPKKSVFLVNPREQRGIHCRFGMRSVIAEAHWDGSRNAVVMLGGLRRWILTHPDQCANMHMLPNSHPSGRHSAVDWSNPDVQKFPNFAKVMGNEVILRPGDFLFVPTYWIHYIVSLNVNFQCNTRSGIYAPYTKYINQCGF